MGYETVGRLIDKWLNDPGFRQALRQDPEGTAKKMGMKFSDEEWAALRQVDWKLSDDELRSRVSKAFG